MGSIMDLGWGRYITKCTGSYTIISAGIEYTCKTYMSIYDANTSLQQRSYYYTDCSNTSKYLKDFNIMLHDVDKNLNRETYKTEYIHTCIINECK